MLKEYSSNITLKLFPSTPMAEYSGHDLTWVIKLLLFLLRRTVIWMHFCSVYGSAMERPRFMYCRVPEIKLQYQCRLYKLEINLTEHKTSGILPCGNKNWVRSIWQDRVGWLPWLYLERCAMPELCPLDIHSNVILYREEHWKQNCGV